MAYLADDHWTARACRLLYALEVATAEELAGTVGRPAELILEHAEPFTTEQTLKEFAEENRVLRTSTRKSDGGERARPELGCRDSQTLSCHMPHAPTKSRGIS